MPDKATISHRGEKYEIGRGKRFYGIWMVGAPYEAPVDRWPETRDGWEQAWTRFATVEVPGTIAAVPASRSGLGALLKSRRAAANGGVGPAGRRGGTAVLVGEGLLVLGVVLGLAGLFPMYAGGQSLLSQGDQLVPHLCYVIAWAISAGPIALSVSRPRAARLGALFALGLSAVTLGLFVTDVGEVVSGGASLGTGLIVSLLGWTACTAGAAIALVASCRDIDADPGSAGAPGTAATQRSGARADCGWPAKPSRGHLGPLALLTLAGAGTAAAFAPSWDAYTVSSAASGTVQRITAGDAFSNPALIIAGDVTVMATIVVLAALAALWRPARQGALLLAGAIVPLAAQAVSALLQVHQSPYAAFNLTPAKAAAAGVSITAGVTPIFWVYCVFVVSLLISCAWLLTAPGHAAGQASPWGHGPHGGEGWAPAGPASTPVDARPADVPPAGTTPAHTVPSNADADTVPSNADADTVPSNADADTVPSNADAGTVPSNADADTVPSNADAGTGTDDPDKAEVSPSPNL